MKKEKEQKRKEGLSRLFELTGKKKSRLYFHACDSYNEA